MENEYIVCRKMTDNHESNTGVFNNKVRDFRIALTFFIQFAGVNNTATLVES